MVFDKGNKGKRVVLAPVFSEVLQQQGQFRQLTGLGEGSGEDEKKKYGDRFAHECFQCTQQCRPKR